MSGHSRFRVQRSIPVAPSPQRFCCGRSSAHRASSGRSPVRTAHSARVAWGTRFSARSSVPPTSLSPGMRTHIPEMSARSPRRRPMAVTRKIARRTISCSRPTRPFSRAHHRSRSPAVRRNRAMDRGQSPPEGSGLAARRSRAPGLRRTSESGSPAGQAFHLTTFAVRLESLTCGTRPVGQRATEVRLTGSKDHTMPHPPELHRASPPPPGPQGQPSRPAGEPQCRHTHRRNYVGSEPLVACIRIGGVMP